MSIKNRKCKLEINMLIIFVSEKLILQYSVSPITLARKPSEMKK